MQQSDLGDPGRGEVATGEASGTGGRRVAVVGLGNIGGGVARNLVRAGHQVAVADLDPTKVAELVALGATAAATPADAAQTAQVVFTSLPGPTQIAAVGEQLVAAMAPDTTWVELSTNDLDTARHLAQRCADAGVALIDAPVSGGPEGAEAGTLSIFVGGEPAAVAGVADLLDAIGDKVDHLGTQGPASSPRSPR